VSVTVDINECIRFKPCDENAFCINTIGRYMCRCKLGYDGNGLSCTKIPQPPGINITQRIKNTATSSALRPEGRKTSVPVLGYLLHRQISRSMNQ